MVSDILLVLDCDHELFSSSFSSKQFHLLHIMEMQVDPLSENNGGQLVAQVLKVRLFLLSSFRPHKLQVLAIDSPTYTIHSP